VLNFFFLTVSLLGSITYMAAGVSPSHNKGLLSPPPCPSLPPFGLVIQGGLHFLQPPCPTHFFTGPSHQTVFCILLAGDLLCWVSGARASPLRIRTLLCESCYSRLTQSRPFPHASFSFTFFRGPAISRLRRRSAATLLFFSFFFPASFLPHFPICFSQRLFPLSSGLPGKN